MREHDERAEQSLTTTGGFISLILASVCTSSIPVAVKIGIQQEASPFELVVFRVVVSALVLWLYFLCFKPNAVRIDCTGIMRCALAALANCVSMSCYFLALYYIDASLSIIVYATTLIPVVMLILMIRGERPSQVDLSRFLIALIGLYLFIGFLGQVNLMGIGLSIAVAFFYGMHLTLIQLYLGDYESLTVTLYVLTSMAVILSPIYLGFGYGWPHFDATTWWAVLWIAVVATAIARFLLFVGIKIAGSRQAALISPLETLLAVLFAVWWLGEWLTLSQWLGTALVVLSVGLGAKSK